MKRDLEKFARKHHWWWRTNRPVRDQELLKVERIDGRIVPRFSYKESLVWKYDPKRGTTVRGPHPLSQTWKDGEEHAAFLYELVRRLHPEKELPTFPWLNDRIQYLLKRQFGKTQLIWTSRELSGCVSLDAVRKDPDHTVPIQFNLHASDSALLQTFKRFIAEQRTQKRIRTPTIPSKNSVSWRWLELWDMNELEEVPLTRSEHSMKSKAKRRAIEAEPALLEFINRNEKEIFSLRSKILYAY